jgi:hypothetical protein
MRDFAIESSVGRRCMDAWRLLECTVLYVLVRRRVRCCIHACTFVPCARSVEAGPCREYVVAVHVHGESSDVERREPRHVMSPASWMALDVATRNRNNNNNSNNSNRDRDRNKNGNRDCNKNGNRDHNSNGNNEPPGQHAKPLAERAHTIHAACRPPARPPARPRRLVGPRPGRRRWTR